MNSLGWMLAGSFEERKDRVEGSYLLLGLLMFGFFLKDLAFLPLKKKA